jgi:drug/metabolite transporter (DMT)-like permease
MNIGYVYAFSAAIAWGILYAIDQKLLKSISPISLIYLDAVVVFLIGTVVLLVRKDLFVSLTSSVKATGWQPILLAIGIAFTANLLSLVGIKFLGASRLSFIEIAYPFFVVLFTALLFKEKPSLALLLGGILIAAGSWIIIRG